MPNFILENIKLDLVEWREKKYGHFLKVSDEPFMRSASK
jgi:hypothetical protein